MASKFTRFKITFVISAGIFVSFEPKNDHFSPNYTRSAIFITPRLLVLSDKIFKAIRIFTFIR